MQTPRHLSRDITVGDEGPISRKTKLTAMRMPSQNEIGSVFAHCVKNSAIGRMRHTEAEISGEVKAAGNCGVVIQLYVRIIYAADVES